MRERERERESEKKRESGRERKEDEKAGSIFVQVLFLFDEKKLNIVAYIFTAK